jgi:hypothetical protein
MKQRHESVLNAFLTISVRYIVAIAADWSVSHNIRGLSRLCHHSHTWPSVRTWLPPAKNKNTHRTNLTGRSLNANWRSVECAARFPPLRPHGPVPYTYIQQGRFTFDWEDLPLIVNNLICSLVKHRRDSSVSRATGYGSESRVELFVFHLSTPSSHVLGAQPASYTMDNEGSFLGGKAAEAWSWTSTWN